MSLYTLSFLCALAIFSLQVPDTLGNKYIYFPPKKGGKTVIKAVKFIQISGSSSGGWEAFKSVIPKNFWNLLKPVNPNKRPNPSRRVNPNNRRNPSRPVNPNNRPNSNKPSENSGRGSSRGSPSSSSSVNPREIVNKHNDLRSRVSPPASNMMKMRWSKKLAANAQKWANKCTLGHTPRKQRYFGENLYMSGGPSTWDIVIQKWYNEVKFWKYGVGPTQKKKVVGHYTQIVWAKSNKIGCGMATCPKARMKYFFVCQYTPAGNSNRMYKQFPYKKGRSCSACRGSCEKNKLCT